MAKQQPIDPNSEGGGPGPCFVTDMISVVMFRIATTHELAFDFRDKMLARTQLGKRFVGHYETNHSELFRVVRKDPKLVADCVDAWVAVAPFVRDMLAAPDASGSKNSKEPVRFSRKDHARWVALIGRFRSGSKNKTFRKVLDELEPELARYVGLGAAEAVEKLRSTPQRK